MEKLELKHISPYLPYGLKVQYNGVLNGKELGEWDRKYIKDFGDDVFKPIPQESEERPNEIIGLKIGNIRMVGIYKNHIKYHIGVKMTQTHYGTDNFKPILRPLSDLTKEIEVNGEKFVPNNIYPFKYFIKEDLDYFLSQPIDFINYNQAQKLFEWHFDVFGLIEKGLAVDINTL